MRITYSVLYLILIIALVICTFLARYSDKPAKNSVAFLEAALIPPVLGNLLIVAGTQRTLAVIGHYFYYLGMALVMGALVNFTNSYCRRNEGHRTDPYIAYLFLVFDGIQLLLNPVFGHAFGVKIIEVEGFDYYKLVPYFGQTIHRIIVYGVFISIILMFTLLSFKTPKINRERFTVILVIMLCVGLVQTYNIFFQNAIDRSMLGYGLFGLVIFYFALRYRPLRLLDRLLSNIVTDLSDAFYIFDPNGNCLWANEQGCKLAGIEGDHFEMVTGNLKQRFGNPTQRIQSDKEHEFKRTVGEGAQERFYILEEKQVLDEKGHLDGSYLRIQDITESEKQLKAREEQIGQISQEAYKDALTGVGSKNAYTKKVQELNTRIAAGHTEFAVVMIDINDLKGINDDYGHRAGDLFIKGCCHLICEAFKHSPVYRIGGDEFVVILQGQDYDKRTQITDELRGFYAAAFAQTNVEPWYRYSAAVGIAERASDDSTYELIFKRADQEMYEEKKAFKKKHGSYR